MKKKPHAFRSYVTDWVESEEFRKQEEQYPEPSEPMQIGLPGGRKINVNKDLFEGKEITVLQRKKNNGKTTRFRKT